MIVVIVALVALYIRSGISLWSTWNASRAASAKVSALEGQNARLKHQRSELHASWAGEAAARGLGMAHPGEKTYEIQGLPRN